MDKRSSDAAKAKRAETMMSRHGVVSAMQSREIVEKANATKLDKFGTLKPPGSGRKRMTLDEFVSRAREIHGDKYDYSQVILAGNSVKVNIICPIHGVFQQTPAKHLMGRGCTHKDCIAAKKIATTQARFHVDNAMQDAGVKKKQAASNVNKFGVENAMKASEVQEKLIATNMAKYQVPYSCMADSVRAQRKTTCTERYGGPSPMCSQEIREKAQATMMKKHRVKHALQARSFLEKSERTNMDRRGVKNPMQCKAIADKMTASKLANGTANLSSTEELLYNQLCQVFGEDNIIRQYKSDKYQWHCDFYIKSRDMYIELNAGFFHNHRWFDCNSSEDYAILGEFRKKAMLDTKSSYAGVIKTWSVYDVKKRQAARDAKLNYVVFWDDDLRDAAIWFAMGCPDGQDWLCEYSWLPERDIRGIDLNMLPELSSNHINLSLIAKAYQFHVFYAREEQLWAENNLIKNSLPLQIFIYHNRLKYKRVTPEQISDLQLMRAFTISGVLKGYTVFDTRLMDLAVNKYNIKSIYDPCAGWGERALYCRSKNMSYLGVDVNQKLFDGYAAMWAAYDMTDQNFIHGDSSNINLSGQYQAVLTCPPYGNTEIYTSDGAENLDKYAFLSWWRDLIANSMHVNPEYFCFQINQKWRDLMSDIVIQSGFELIDEFYYNSNRVSHFHRRDGVNTKREFESMLVFRRI